MNGYACFGDWKEQGIIVSTGFEAKLTLMDISITYKEGIPWHIEDGAFKLFKCTFPGFKI